MNRKSYNLAGFALAAMLFLASCSSLSHIEMFNGTHLSKYKTYGWVDEKNTSESKTDRSRNIIYQNITMAVDGQLQKIGWRNVLVSSDLMFEKN